jgi:hypothetical protein
MSLTVVWEKCSVDKPVARDKNGRVTQVEAITLNRGESLPDFVDDFVRSTLTMIGAVRDLGIAVQAVQAATDAQFAEEPAPPIYPPEVPPVVTGPPPEVVNPQQQTTGEVTGGDNPTYAANKPGAGDSKEQWESYAVGKGYLTQTEAEALTKTKLVAEVNKRESN